MSSNVALLLLRTLTASALGLCSLQFNFESKLHPLKSLKQVGWLLKGR